MYMYNHVQYVYVVGHFPLQTTKKLHELESNLETTVKKTTRKVQTLKAQFYEHKKKWESVR